MKRVLSAKSAILVHLKPIGIVLLVFNCVVIALLAFRASQGNFDSHDGTSRFTEIFSLPQPGKIGAKKKTRPEVKL